MAKDEKKETTEKKTTNSKKVGTEKENLKKNTKNTNKTESTKPKKTNKPEKEEAKDNKETLSKAEQKAKDKQELENVKAEIKRIKGLKKARKIQDKKVLSDSLEKAEADFNKEKEDIIKKEGSIPEEKNNEITSNYKWTQKQIKYNWKEKYKKGRWDHENKENIIEVKDVEKYYISPGNVTPVLQKLNVNIKKGDVVAILGPSGSGKTTLLNLISGLDTAQAGDIVVNNRNLRYLSDSDLTKFRASNVSFIFQSYNLLPTLNVIENVKTGSQLQKDKEKKLDELDLLKKLELHEERYKYSYQLSGGQQQRVSIARALAKNPAILFADEPTGALDTDTSVQVLEALLKVNKDFGTTIVLVTHNLLISKICNQVIRIKNGAIQKIDVNKKPLKPSQIKWE